VTTSETPIYIDQGDGSYKKFTGSVEDLRVKGWPEYAPAGTLKTTGSVSSALDNVYSRADIDAQLLTFRPPTERDWEQFKRFIAEGRAD
jgi:hypothetical protein